MKKNGKKSRKIRKLIITCVLSAIVLIVSTYTWFIGLQTVKVNPFEIEIATTEGLFLSTDGKNWVYNLDVNDTTYYEGNTNVWATDGLIPMSSVGDLDSTSSTMKLFEKASLTTSPGGYRLLASRVNNNASSTKKVNGVDVTVYEEGNGYIAFDLFIKNLSGNEYYEKNEVANEEDIFLNLGSSVTVKTNGSDNQEKTGIENSIRLGFTQIGRVEATTPTVSTITGINCTGTDMSGSSYKYTLGDVTGICRNAQIWEPNDTDHENNALNWYNTSCITRKSEGATITDKASYNVATYNTNGVKTADATYCYATGGNTKKHMADNGNALPTYAISREIKIADNVDVYDGAVLNTYTSNTIDYETYAAATESTTPKKSSYKLVDFPYFTDTMKEKTGMERPTFMTLAPNSITKVRVYIWLEGQDIDNYDFASLGKTISINFGFTKERFETTDLGGYDGPDLVTSDNADISTADHAQQ